MVMNTHFHMKGFAFGLSLASDTQKWPIAGHLSTKAFLQTIIK